ncbi:MAG: hypothetical protein JWL58_248 [Streptosporangiaceae bacterium]|jgi:hypothetical protein|nr:hypothetical protein [Streptosporangiaceae bacterium]
MVANGDMIVPDQIGEGAAVPPEGRVYALS